VNCRKLTQNHVKRPDGPAITLKLIIFIDTCRLGEFSPFSSRNRHPEDTALPLEYGKRVKFAHLSPVSSTDFLDKKQQSSCNQLLQYLGEIARSKQQGMHSEGFNSANRI
jgi:hypothetical protein